MYKFKIHTAFNFVFLAGVVFMIGLMITAMSVISSRAHAMKREIGADKVVYCYQDLNELYAGYFGTISHIQETLDDSYDSVLSTDAKTYFLLYNEDGSDAVDTLSEVTELVRISGKNSKLIDFSFLMTALVFALEFVCLLTCIFSEKQYYYMTFAMVASVIIACFILSGQFYFHFIAMGLFLLSGILDVVDIFHINRVNYKIAHRNDAI